ncbi:WD40-repeat-containing domain protein [Dunaliella salina]|uniref:WD40-repeat-containing domain protein n=1 Tax=Dunaliella salina TaxID=3046 RepID=A0ABQ7GIG3_DUNSA|nr:WD40-repeat-containing domain protein [Dunaliella salina]|eukprot:KAF5834400.1 WD40-repeat-containing domain protein [Dunaliella salina]
MDLLNQYRDSDDEQGNIEEEAGPSMPLSTTVQAAPDVDTTGLTIYDDKAVSASSTRHLLAPTTRKTIYNAPYEDMHAPALGPAHPYNKDGLAAGLRNHRIGHVEDLYMHPYHFDEQYNTYHSMGYAHAPGGSHEIVGNSSEWEKRQGETVTGQAKRRKTTAEKREEAAAKMARMAPIDPTVPFTLEQRQPWAHKEVHVEAAKMESAADQVEAKGPTSFFHGKEEKDYQGRSWLAAPKEQRRESDVCYMPKRWIHTWSGHTKGVNAIRFFPNSGHLLLSAGLDGKIKIWDVLGSGKCMRTYLGHSKGVRDITFSNDGRRFVSTGYDKNIRVWDTETGKALQTFNTGKINYCVTLHPEKQNVLLAGASDKKIYQWDLDSGDIVQIKYLADPSMHSMPAVAMNPTNTVWVGQSQGNEIVSYACSKGEKFKHLKNKTFKGHNTAGYACTPGFSPDGKYVYSGDSEGRCFFWEWSRPQKVMRTIKAHEGVCIGAAWHPMESSKVATCGWDGLIKYWD